MIDEIVQIAARDGTSIGARVYRPDGAGPFPALFGASPYRFDNNSLPASPQFLWRETGPIEWYVEQGYAYVHMDVRGSGRSGGAFEFLGRGEQMGQSGMGAVQKAEHVQLDHPLPLLHRRVDDRPEQHHPGVVDQDVEPAERVMSVSNGLADLGQTGHVHLKRHCSTSQCSDGFDDVAR